MAVLYSVDYRVILLESKDIELKSKQIFFLERHQTVMMHCHSLSHTQSIRWTCLVQPTNQRGFSVPGVSHRHVNGLASSQPAGLEGGTILQLDCL